MASLLQKLENIHEIDVTILRDDLLHPFISGNKIRKLKYNLEDFKKSGKEYMLTFGGAFSNHLVAVAAAGEENNFKTIGIIRGEKIENEYIRFLKSKKMLLHFISRANYRNKTSNDFIRNLKKELMDIFRAVDSFFILPEGGANAAAIKGAGEIMNDIPPDTEFIIVACGTGATISGISKNLLHHQKVIGISVLKLKGYFEKVLKNSGCDLTNTEIIYDYHFGGYAKSNNELVNFCKTFSDVYRVPAEPVYTGKMFYAFMDMMKNNYFRKGSKVTLVHTGGIFNFSSKEYHNFLQPTYQQ
jgi:1-aminocyclopropane-1-carboxylate deaminase